MGDNRRRWTPEEIETIRRLASEGMDARSIGRVLGRSKNSVLGAVAKHIHSTEGGSIFKRTHHSRKTLETIEALSMKGLSGGEIARAVGLTRNAVNGLIDRNIRNGPRVRASNADRKSGVVFVSPDSIPSAPRRFSWQEEGA